MHCQPSYSEYILYILYSSLLGNVNQFYTPKWGESLAVYNLFIGTAKEKKRFAFISMHVPPRFNLLSF